MFTAFLNFCDIHTGSIFIYSCIARKTFLDDKSHLDIQNFSKISDVAGFFTYGEFFTSKKDHSFLNQTLTLLSLSEEKLASRIIRKESNLTQTDGIIRQKALSNLVNTTSYEIDVLNDQLKNKIEEKGISDQITDKTCLCMGLAATAVINYGIETRESKGVSICPGPNMAYFNQELSLQDMSHHIYNGDEGIVRTDRPHMFVNELGMYLKYLSEKIEEHKEDWGRKSGRYLNGFTANMNEGISYYQKMFSSIGDTFNSVKESAINSLNDAAVSMQKMGEEIATLIEEKK